MFSLLVGDIPIKCKKTLPRNREHSTFVGVISNNKEYKMKYEKPEIVKIVVEEKKEAAMGPDGCSTAWSGCCYKD